jgi:DNA-binding winged helix-turn-helix (wHTH) protein
MPRYRFSNYVVSPRRRMLMCDGREQPLIPRYFDLLVFLIERRHEAVHRRDIFDRVWSEVIVSDSALSQAIRTIRRTLGDDPREPRFIRTVSRHGYRFVYADVVEEEDEGPAPVNAAAAQAARPEPQAPPPPPPSVPEPAADPFAPLLDAIAREPAPGEEEDQREAAEMLHALGTTEAVRRLGTRPGHAHARALLRDTRWDVAGAQDVPLLGQPGALTSARTLIRLRLQRAARIAAARWAAAAVGGGMAGVVAGAAGGLILAAVPTSTAPLALSAVLASIGGACGFTGGAGVGAGLAVAEAVARSRRGVALVCGAAIGGGLAGFLVQLLGTWSLDSLVGLTVNVGGGVEGLLIGGAAGAGYALATLRADGGLAAPRGTRRLRAVAVIAAGCGIAALILTLWGRALVGGTIHRISQASEGSHATLAPLGRLVGEPGFGPISGSLLGTGEGIMFGVGLALGLTRRPRR